MTDDDEGDYACPDSDEVTPTDADRDTWLHARRAGIGGSDASTIAGVNPYTTLYGLWLDKTGRAPEQPDSAVMRFGRLIEDDARTVFTEDTGIGVRLAGMQRNRERPWQLYTPDGLTADGGVLEIKSVGWRLAEKWADGQVADHAEVQVQHGMAVTGRTHAWVVAVIERDFVIRRVERDPALIATLTDMEREFWETYVVGGEEPPIVAADLDAVRDVWPDAEPGTVKLAESDWLPELLTERAAAIERLRLAQGEKDRLDAELTNFLGDAEAGGWVDTDGTGLVAVTRKAITQRRIDTARLRTDHPDLAAAYTTETVARRLTVLNKPRRA